MKTLPFAMLLGLLVSVGSGRPLWAQIDLPPLSPEAYIKQKVGFVTVEVTYCRPSMHGRVIFGEVVPFGEVWRTGANASTKLRFSQEVALNNYKVPPGEYALYTIPGENEWTIILSKNTKLWGAYGYKESEDLVRFKVIPEKILNHVETFTIDVGELTNTSATVQLRWENTMVRVSLGTQSDE